MEVIVTSLFNRVKMNVTHQLQQVDILLAQNGLVAVLKEVVPPERDQKPSHDRGDGNGASSEQKVKMLCEAPYYVKSKVPPS